MINLHKQVQLSIAVATGSNQHVLCTYVVTIPHSLISSRKQLCRISHVFSDKR